jgi:hypothetical protein
VSSSTSATDKWCLILGFPVNENEDNDDQTVLFGDYASLAKRFEQEVVSGDYPVIRLCQIREEMVSEYNHYEYEMAEV